jgi:hypothetical protein
MMKMTTLLVRDRTVLHLHFEFCMMYMRVTLYLFSLQMAIVVWYGLHEQNSIQIVIQSGRTVY